MSDPGAAQANLPVQAGPAPAAPLEVEAGRPKEPAPGELVRSMFGPEVVENFKALPKAEKHRIVASLMMAGLSMREAAREFDISPCTISKWFLVETDEMQRLIKEAMGRDAVVEMPRTWKRLKDMRFSINAETARKAVLDCMRAAGLGIDLGLAGAGQQININAQNVQFQNMPLMELDKKILELSKRLGPEADRLARDEGVKSRAMQDGQSGSIAGEGPGTLPGPPGGAPAPQP